MPSYARLTVWTDGDPLTPEDLNAEFDAIKALLNGGLDTDNFADGVLNTTEYINAGDDRFQTGGLTSDKLVEAAIAEAVAGDIKVVLVPRALFGYAEEATFSPSIFDTSVLVIREGGPLWAHDPVAYGAKPDDATVDDTASYQAAFDGAAASAIGGNPGARLVYVTLAGEYQLDSDVTHDDATGYLEASGVTIASGAAGEVTSALGTTGHSDQGEIPQRGLAHVTRTVENVYVNIAGSGSNTGATALGVDPAEYAVAEIKVIVTEGDPAVDGPNTGFGLAGARVDTTNSDTTITRVEDDGAGNTFIEWTTNNTGGPAEDFKVDLEVFFVKRVPWGDTA